MVNNSYSCIYGTVFKSPSPILLALIKNYHFKKANKQQQYLMGQIEIEGDSKILIQMLNLKSLLLGCFVHLFKIFGSCFKILNRAPYFMLMHIGKQIKWLIFLQNMSTLVQILVFGSVIFLKEFYIDYTLICMV